MTDIQKVIYIAEKLGCVVEEREDYVWIAGRYYRTNEDGEITSVEEDD